MPRNRKAIKDVIYSTNVNRLKALRVYYEAKLGPLDDNSWAKLKALWEDYEAKLRAVREDSLDKVNSVCKTLWEDYEAKLKAWTNLMTLSARS